MCIRNIICILFFSLFVGGSLPARRAVLLELNFTLNFLLVFARPIIDILAD